MAITASDELSEQRRRSGSVEKVVIDLHTPIDNASKSREILEIQLRFLIICSFEFAGFLQSQTQLFLAARVNESYQRGHKGDGGRKREECLMPNGE